VFKKTSQTLIVPPTWDRLGRRDKRGRDLLTGDRRTNGDNHEHQERNCHTTSNPEILPR